MGRSLKRCARRQMHQSFRRSATPAHWATQRFGTSTPALVAAALLFTAACGAPNAASRRTTSLTVAAAANLSQAFEEAGRRFTNETGINVTYSYGATGQ